MAIESNSNATTSGGNSSSSSGGRSNASGTNPQRQRTVMQSLDPTHVGLFSRLKEIGVNVLSSEAAATMKLNRRYLLVQLLRIISPGATQKASIYSSRRRNGVMNSKEVTFSRLFLCRVHPEEGMVTDHGRLIYLMQARNSKSYLFEDNKEWRDNGIFTIGTFFRILACTSAD